MLSLVVEPSVMVSSVVEPSQVVSMVAERAFVRSCSPELKSKVEKRSIGNRGTTWLILSVVLSVVRG